MIEAISVTGAGRDTPRIRNRIRQTGAAPGDAELAYEAIWQPHASATCASTGPSGGALLYGYDGHTWVVGRTVRELLRAGLELRVDDAYLVHRNTPILRTESETNRTPFIGIRHVRPGETVRLIDGRDTPQSTWARQPEHRDAADAADGNGEEAIERLGALMVEATRKRADGRIGMLISGGLDSAITAGALGENDPEIQIAGYCGTPCNGYDGGHPDHFTADESAAARDLIAARPGLRVTAVQAVAGTLTDVLQRETSANLMPLPNPESLHWIAKSAAELGRSGSRATLLHSAFGNHSISYWGAENLAADWRRGRRYQALREIAALRLRGERLAAWTTMREIRAASTLGRRIAGILRRKPNDSETPLGRQETAINPGLVARELGGRRGTRSLRERRAAVENEIEGRLFYAEIERRYEVRITDATADWRLREACLEAPADTFLKYGTMRRAARATVRRWFGKRIAANRVCGAQSCDRHVHLTVRLDWVRERMDEWRRNPEFAERFDTARAWRALETWPARNPWTPKDHPDAVWIRAYFARVLMYCLWLDALQRTTHRKQERQQGADAQASTTG